MLDLWGKSKNWLHSDDGILLFLLIFFPIGLYLLWRYGKNSNPIKIFVTCTITIIFISVTSFFFTYGNLESKINELEINQRLLSIKAKELEDKLKKEETAFAVYKGIMKPYEELAAQDEEIRKVEEEQLAIQLETDTEIAKKIIKLIDTLPSLGSVELSDKLSIMLLKKSYDELTTEQQELVENYSKLNDLVAKIEELESNNKKQDEEKKQKENERIAQEKEEAEKKAAEEKKAKEDAEKKANRTSLDFAYQSEYSSYGEVMIAIDALNEFSDSTLMTASYYESYDGYKNAIKLSSNDYELSNVINDIVETGEYLSDYNDLMESIARTTNAIDSNIQIMIVNSFTDNVITIIRGGKVIDSLVGN